MTDHRAKSEENPDATPPPPGAISRRAVLRAALGASAALAAGGAALASASPASASPAPLSLVLIHGGFHGAWQWRPLVDALARPGRRIIAPTLPGTGDRSHQLEPGISFADGVDDIVAMIDAEELKDIVLVGHSIGGAYASAVAERIEDRLRGVVYLDAVIVDPGERVLDMLMPESRAQLPETVAVSGEGYFVPKPTDPTRFGLTRPRDIAWVERRLTPHPWSTWNDIVPITGRAPAVPKLYIDCTQPSFPNVSLSKQRVRRRSAQWRIVELATCHDAMIPAPREVADFIEGFCRDL